MKKFIKFIALVITFAAFIPAAQAVQTTSGYTTSGMGYSGKRARTTEGTATGKYGNQTTNSKRFGRKGENPKAAGYRGKNWNRQGTRAGARTSRTIVY